MIPWLRKFSKYKKNWIQNQWKKKKNEEMEIVVFEDLPKLFVSPIEKSMDGFRGTIKDLRGLFKVPRENTQIGNFHFPLCM